MDDHDNNTKAAASNGRNNVTRHPFYYSIADLLSDVH